jgi:hypothetical protein
MHYDEEGANGEGSVRIQHQFKVEPNTVRSLEPGEAYLISRGRAMRAQILTAPNLTRPLPDHAPAPQDGAGQAHLLVQPLGAPDEAPVSTPAHVDQERLPPSVPRSAGLSDKEVANLPF